MSLVIVKPGMMDTIQDSGRYGYGSMGINPTGAIDLYAFRVANALVGNKSGEAVIECHFPAAQILFEEDALISITGADFRPMLNTELLPLSKPILIRRNTVLHFKKIIKGARCYLAVNGGFDITQWLGSYSTNITARSGGWLGRKLKTGDRISLRESVEHSQLSEGKILLPLPWQANIRNDYFSSTLKFIRGNEWDLLDDQSCNLFTNSSFIIDHSSDKMGYNLKSDRLQLKQQTEMISSPVSFGTVQLLPNGQLIILMSDHQTTGGYPRLAQIISAHLPTLAQMRPSQQIRFEETNMATAEKLLFAQHHHLEIIMEGCKDHLNKAYARH